MKHLNLQSCCTKIPENAATPVCSGEKPRSLRYILYMIPLLALWWIVYQKLTDFSRLVTYTVLRLQEGSHLSIAIEFFIYETPKVLMLLVLVVFGVGIVRSFFLLKKPEKYWPANANLSAMCWQHSLGS